MKYLKTYMSIHIHYWWIYIFTVLTMSLSFGIGTVLILCFAFTNKDVSIAEKLAQILFGIISSLPLLVPNYKVSIEISKYYNKGRPIYFILNQSISIIIYYIFYRIYIFLQY